MIIRTQVNVSPGLLDRAGGQFTTALSRALNFTRDEAQSRLQERLRQKFTIAPTRLQFMERLIKRDGTATTTKLSAGLAIVGPGGKGGRGRAAILARHVFGGVHTRNDPNNAFFIPADVLRPTATSLPPQGLYPANLRLQDRRAISGGTQALKATISSTGTVQIANTKRVRIAGKKGRGSTEKRSFFVVPFNNAQGRTPGIYERTRTGPDKGDLQLLWLYRKRVNLGAPRLPFFAIVQQTVDTRFNPLLAREISRLGTSLGGRRR